MSFIRFLKGHNDLSYSTYAMRMGFAWFYACVWAAALTAIWVYWDALGTYLKPIILLVLIILTPTGSEFVVSYKKYKDRGW